MEKYLRHCLDSLIVPNMDKVEVLVINDGSKDSSSAIAHEYQEKYPQTFRVIDKENGNYGSCINRGLKEATGKYVKVLDADDSFDKAGFTQFINDLDKLDVDLILTDFVMVDETGNITDKYEFGLKNINMPTGQPFDFVKYINMPNTNFYGQMHGLTYRLAILKQMEYRQTEHISYTDQEWSCIPMCHVSSCYYLPICVYKYLIGREGQTMQNVGKAIKQLVAVVMSMISFLYGHSFDTKNYKKYYISQIEIQINVIYYNGLYLKTYPIETLKDFDKILSKYTDLYSSTNELKVDNFNYICYWRRNEYRNLPFKQMLIRKSRLFLKRLLRK